jgi:hypothetical protein
VVRKITLIGAGQTSLLLGCGLLQHGYDVTIYSESSSAEIAARPCAAPRIMYDTALGYERELGLDFWDAEALWFDTIHVEFSLGPDNLLLALEGQPRDHGQTLDQRVTHSRWLTEFERRGGTVVARRVDPADVGDLALGSDLVVVATGRGGLTELFELDRERTAYSEPPRKQTLLTVRGLEPRPETLTLHLTAADGDIFEVPYRSPGGERCHGLLFEAHPGGKLDRLHDAPSSDELLARGKSLVRDLAPWDDERFAGIELVDAKGWQHFALIPVVRKAASRPLEGRHVLGVGDTVLVLDPATSQGANLATKHARFMTERIVAHGGARFDAEWMQAQFDDFWESDAKFAYAFSAVLLEAPKAYREVELAATRNPAIANMFCEGLNAPPTLWPWIDEIREARRFIARTTGRPWWTTALRARASVARNQVAQRATRDRPRVQRAIVARAQRRDVPAGGLAAAGSSSLPRR